MRKVFVYLFLVLLTQTAYAQGYFIAFLAENPNTTGVGHAFIGIGKGTPLTCDVNGNTTELWGFYPKSRLSGGKSFWAGPVEGKIMSDIRTHADHFTYRRIDFADYLKIQLKVEEWKKKQYRLTKNDCVTFFIDVAGLFPGKISIPDRTKFQTPGSFVSQFINANKGRE